MIYCKIPSQSRKRKHCKNGAFIFAFSICLMHNIVKVTSYCKATRIYSLAIETWLVCNIKLSIDGTLISTNTSEALNMMTGQHMHAHLEEFSNSRTVQHNSCVLCLRMLQTRLSNSKSRLATKRNLMHTDIPS